MEVADLACDAHAVVSDPMGYSSAGVSCDNTPAEQLWYGDDSTCSNVQDDRRRRQLTAREATSAARQRRLAAALRTLWLPEAGALGASYLLPARNLTLYQAQEACVEDERCRGYSYFSAHWHRDPEASGLVHLLRGGSATIQGDLDAYPNKDFRWTTHLKSYGQVMSADYGAVLRHEFPLQVLMRKLSGGASTTVSELKASAARLHKMLEDDTRTHEDLTTLMRGDERKTAAYMETLGRLADYSQNEHTTTTTGDDEHKRRRLTSAMDAMGHACTVYGVVKDCAEDGTVGGCASAVAKGILETATGAALGDGAWECATTGNCPDPWEMEVYEDPIVAMQSNCARVAAGG